MIVLKENFNITRQFCPYRTYHQEYHNEGYCNGRKLGEWGIDYGRIKCEHKMSSTGWCRINMKKEDCPRVMS